MVTNRTVLLFYASLSRQLLAVEGTKTNLTKGTQKVFGGVRLGYEADIPLTLKGFTQLGHTLAGGEHCRERRIDGPNFGEQRVATAVGQTHIDDNPINPARHQSQLVHGLRSRAGNIDLEASFLEVVGR